MTNECINLRGISSLKDLGKKIENMISSLTRVIILDNFEEFEALVKIIHEQKYSLELSEYYLTSTIDQFQKLLNEYNVGGFIIFGIFRGTNVTNNDFFNRIKNCFDFFHDFSSTTDSQKSEKLSDYISRKISLLKNQHLLTVDQCTEIEKLLNKYNSKGAVNELKRMERLDH